MKPAAKNSVQVFQEGGKNLIIWAIAYSSRIYTGMKLDSVARAWKEPDTDGGMWPAYLLG